MLRRLLERLRGRRPDVPEPHGEEYRRADPRDVVEEGGTVMSGPGGAPQEGLTTEERRELDRD